MHRLSEPTNLHNDEAIAESLRITSPSLAAVTQPLIFLVSSACYATTDWMSHSSLPNSATYVLRACTHCWCKWNLQVSSEAWMMYFSATQMGNGAKVKRKDKVKEDLLTRVLKCGAWNGMLCICVHDCVFFFSTSLHNSKCLKNFKEDSVAFSQIQI